MKSFLFRLAISLLSLAIPVETAFAADPPPAKKLFGAVRLPSKGDTESIGFYAKGCLMGGVAIPADGPTWQVLHPSRNRRWGNPAMIGLLERLSRDAHDKDDWNGLLIGDIAQPRGGPMLSGHASHQIGLDADIWLTPMPDRTLTAAERDHFPENSVLRKGGLYVDPNKWTPAHAKVIMQAASYPEVERIFVHPGIKKKLCDTWAGDRSLLAKVRPMYGHHYHFHIRMKCPPGSATCTPQVAPREDSGCGKELTQWFDRLKPRPVPKYADRPKVKPVKPVKPAYLTLNSLPKACTMVLNQQSVTSMAAAEYHGPGAVHSDDAMATNTETAYAAPTEQATTVAFRSIEDFSGLVPRGDVPVPLDRPSE